MIDARPNRFAALKARHRRAILDAAKELISEGGAARFSVDQLAERADVSRRTVFNHFASIDDVVTTVCTEVLGVVTQTYSNGAHDVIEVAAGEKKRLIPWVPSVVTDVDLGARRVLVDWGADW